MLSWNHCNASGWVVKNTSTQLQVIYMFFYHLYLHTRIEVGFVNRVYFRMLRMFDPAFGYILIAIHSIHTEITIMQHIFNDIKHFGSKL